MKNKNPEMKIPCDLIPPIFKLEKSFKVNIQNEKTG